MNKTFDLPESDDLEAMIAAPVRSDVTQDTKVPGFTEVCPQCRGRKVFTSWSGRIVGPCYACKGKGSKTFKTSKESRAQGRAKAQERKVTTQESNVAGFAQAQPEAWAWIVANPGFEFAVSMRGAVERFGSLTEGQLGAVLRCMERNKAREAEKVARVQAAPEVTTTALEDAFGKAREAGLRRIKVRFAGLEVSPASATSRNAGALYVKADGTYVGKITQGKFLCVRECSEATQARVLETLKDPKAAAIAYGRETGSCSCCGRELTDPESVAAGIGPICAGKFGW